MMSLHDTLALGTLLRPVSRLWRSTAMAQSDGSLFDVPAVRRKISAVGDCEAVAAIAGEQGSATGECEDLARISRVAERLTGVVPKRGVEDSAPESLRSIFSQVYQGDTDLVDIHYSPEPLRLEREVLFPRPREETTTDYTSLWNGMLTEWEALPETDYSEFSVALLALLRKYTWCVPIGQDDVSVTLYDYTKTAAALAACLFEQIDQVEALERSVDDGGHLNHEVGLLVGGDLSGIQRFIYAISSDGAAKGLRGRSIFLSLLSEAIASYVLSRLGSLREWNLLSSSGGHFHVLAPWSGRSAVEAIQTELTERLFEALDEEIYCALVGVPLTVKDLLSGACLGDRWRQLGDEMRREKRRRFSGLMAERFEALFEPQGGGGNQPACAVCHSEIGAPPRRTAAEETDDGRPVCSLCHSFERLGDTVVRSRFLLTRRVPTSSAKRLTCWTALETLGTAHKFDTRPGWERSYVLDSTHFLEEGAQGFRFIGRAAPLDCRGHILSFNEMAEAASGVNRWGVLRMDVDSLGAVFSEGLGDDTSLVRLSTLSSMMSLFFEAHINLVCQEEQFSGRSYLIYAGGDDSLIVGSWDTMVELAHRIRQDFRRYVCGNPRMTLSAAVTLEIQKYPLHKAASRAAEALDVAKDLVESRRNLRKDGFTFLGRSVFWDDFEDVLRVREILERLIGTNGRDGVGRGLLGRLNNIHALYRDQEQRLKALTLGQQDLARLVEKARWRWHLVYSLARQRERSARHREDLDTLQQLILGEELMDILEVPIRWVELLTRQKE